MAALQPFFTKNFTHGTVEMSISAFHVWQATVSFSFLVTKPDRYPPLRRAVTFPFEWNLYDFLPSRPEVVALMMSVVKTGLEDQSTASDPFWEQCVLQCCIEPAVRRLSSIGGGGICFVVEFRVRGPARQRVLLQQHEVVDDVLILSTSSGRYGRRETSRTSFGATPAPAAAPTAAAIEKLERVRYEGRHGQLDEKDCPICLQEFRMGQCLTRMPCSHGFHCSCLTRWLGQSSTCPLCRYDLCC